MFLSELNKAVRQRLDDLANIAANGDDHAVTEVARSEMPHLVEAVRRLMAEHEPNERGECPACSRILRRWQRPLRRPKCPCRVYLAARWALFNESPPEVCRSAR
ncbi:hypothetical protein [Gandjariella thermophila]|uniref:Uncharacterized protein n=1 Tax=Gandjariella thermophila TaxID=1931992 RepID=A0A4D4JG98_9PSEU|nr:hypothetical protein [Gandjariella thermophila]GDY32917.1 hypothetical protein GTS_45500 [Gandjariella thermophila]